jgi:hypothetical protein
MSPAIQKPKAKPVVEDPQPTLIKAKPVPDLSKKFEPVIEHRVLPVPEVSLPGDRIHEEMKEKIEKTKAELEEEERKLREFKALPILVEKVIKINLAF